MNAPTDLQKFLAAQEKKSLLRFLTCGSVDDGKSTLIGRLLYDTKLLFEDTLASLEINPLIVGPRGAKGVDMLFEPVGAPASETHP